MNKNFGARLAVAIVWLGAASVLGAPSPEGISQTRFAVISDPHFYDAHLGTSGAAFETYLASDRKLLRESEAILDATIRALLQEDIRFVLVTGDLTKDGELKCHHGFARKMKELEKAGIEVYVVAGNHDVNNPHAFAYAGDTARPVQNVSPDKFATLYHQLGYGQALDRDPHSLSYMFEPAPGFRVLALDSAVYDQNELLSQPVTAGRLSPETQAWALEKLAEAQTLGKQVTAMMHHGLIEHFLGQSRLFPEYVIEDWPTVSLTLAGAGLTTVFTGHFHAQDATFGPVLPGTPIAPAILDIETGSLVTFPSPYRVVTWASDGSMQIESRFIEEIDYDTGGLPFPEYSQGFLRAGLQAQVTYQLTAPPPAGYGLDATTAAILTPALVEGFVAHYAGDENLTLPSIIGLIQVLKSYPPDSLEHFLGLSLESLWTDLPPQDSTFEWGAPF